MKPDCTLECCLVSVHNQLDGTKKAKYRVTINACANVSGAIKLPLLLICKAKNPRCFRNLNKEALLSTKIKQMLGSTVIFSEIGFLTDSSLKQTKTERTSTRRKDHFVPQQLLCPSK